MSTLRLTGELSVTESDYIYTAVARGSDGFGGYALRSGFVTVFSLSIWRKVVQTRVVKRIDPDFCSFFSPFPALQGKQNPIQN